jgi:ABC-2 type transport system permease protein
MINLLRAEWLKVRSVRSTYVILAVIAAFMALAAWIAWYGANTDGAIPLEYRADFALRPQAHLAADVAGLCLAVLAVLAITSELNSGMIRTTFTAVPRRHAIVAAKAVVLSAIALVAGPVSLFTTYFVTRVILDSRPLPGQVLPPVSAHMPTLLAMCLTVIMYTLIGLGLAAIMRSAAAAIATFVALWYFLPIVAGNLPAPWNERIGSYLPGALAGQLAGAGNEHSVFGAILPPLGALAVMLAYMAAPLGVATWLTARRDA